MKKRSIKGLMNAPGWSDIERQARRSIALVEEGDAFGALVCFGEIAAWSPELPPSAREAMHERLKDLVDRVDYAVVQAEVEKAAERIRKIVDVGERFIFEEVVLVLTLRVEIALIGICLREAGWQGESMDLSIVDARLQEIATGTPSRAAYASAVSAMERNWFRHARIDARMLDLGHLFASSGG